MRRCVVAVIGVESSDLDTGEIRVLGSGASDLAQLAPCGGQKAGASSALIPLLANCIHAEEVTG
jgi:hypothetical protein